MRRYIFEDLFVLEMANNHWGDLTRGLRIISEFSKIVRFNNVRAAIKLQTRDAGRFIHKDFLTRTDIRYIKKTLETRMPKDHYEILVEAIRKSGCIPLATPFDEKSVDWCVEFDLPIIKIASADNNDWLLLEKIAKTRRPVIVSTGGTSQKDMDDLVIFFEQSQHPAGDQPLRRRVSARGAECELNQIDFLEPGTRNTSSAIRHEYDDWDDSVTSPTPRGRAHSSGTSTSTTGCSGGQVLLAADQIDTWFKAFRRAKETETQSAFPRTPKSGIWMRWCAAFMRDETYRQAILSIMKKWMTTSISRFPFKRGKFRVVNSCPGRSSTVP